MTYYEKLQAALKCVREKTDFEPKLALVLGSGLGDYADTIDVKATIDYKDIENFPVSTVSGHAGKFVFGYVREVPVVIMQGRVHYYEGYKTEEVVMPIRLMGLMGAKAVFLTNASGGINTAYHAGDFMLIKDHIAVNVPNPLIGANIDELGVRFPDMSNVYNDKLREIIKSTAEELGIGLHEGVYIQLTGPSYETPAEINMAAAIGADAVGMSTAVEAIAANHMGLKVCGISCISNLAAGRSDKPLSHAEVKECADKAAPLFTKLVTESIVNIANKI